MKIKQIDYINQISYFAKLIHTFFKSEKKARILHKDKIIKVSKNSGTVAGALPGSKLLSQFPGIPSKKLICKILETYLVFIKRDPISEQR